MTRMSPLSTLAVTQSRGPLARTLERLRQGSLNIGFIGGSITDGRAPHNWPDPVAAWFAQTFPTVHLRVENAGIGATGSDLAVFRAQADLIDRGCDLVFVEFAVNDSGAATERRNRTREGLLRKLLATGVCDVVLVYTFQQGMYARMMAGEMPDSIAEFEALGQHYGLGSVWMGLNALQEVAAGLMRWEEWLPDGLHPQYRGSLAYAQAVIGYLEGELISGPHARPSGCGTPATALAPALNPMHWESAGHIPLERAVLQGPWIERRWLHYPWADRVLTTAAPGARLACPFNSRAIVLGIDFGHASAEFRYRLDGGKWLLSGADRPEWCGPAGWFRPIVLADDLAPAERLLELEVMHGDTVRCTGTNFALAFIGTVQ